MRVPLSEFSQRSINLFLQSLPLRASMRDPRLFTQLMIDNTEVEYTTEALRSIKPYWPTSCVVAKGKWFGMRLLDVLSRDFHSVGDRAAAADHIEAGRILVAHWGRNTLMEPRIVDPFHVIKMGDVLIAHEVEHRHEPPVPDVQPRLVHFDEAERLLVLDKPPGVPIHPVGTYYMNSLQLQLAKDGSSLFPHMHIDWRGLHCLHRLDRVTSGLLVMGVRQPPHAKHSSASRSGVGALYKAFNDRQVRKTYLARVLGRFPSHATCDMPIFEPHEVISADKLSSEVVPFSEIDLVRGKPARTEFELLHTDGTHSLIACRPITGRQHQIRCHLRFLGYPIANDPLYAGLSVVADSLC